MDLQQQQLSSKPRLVTRRGSKYVWNIPEVDHTLVQTISHQHNLMPPIAHVLAARGYKTEDAINAFLFSSYESDVPHPSSMKGIVVAAERIIKAIKNEEKILIFGDYDVDGVTSSSVALTALIPLGARVNFFLPNREKDGYGLSSKAVKRAKENGYNLIVTVDNGVAAFEAAEKARELGIDLIITDHHKPHDHLPPALTIIDPHQEDCPYPFKHLAGVGVIFKLMTLIYQLLGLKRLPEKVYELLMLGTVADVVPLLGENRFWVRHGLHTINNYRSNAMRMLAQNGNVTKDELTSLDIGFMIAPQINALGRLSDPRDAVRFMISADNEEVQRVGKILKEINEERKKIDGAIFESLDQLIKQKVINLDQDKAIIASDKNWPAGVIGLVAGKLMHSYGRPTILLHLDSHGIAKGSCRSIPEFNMFNALTACQDLLIQFGGHACAAGLKLKQSNIPELKNRLNQLINEQVPESLLQPKITLDAPLSLGDITPTFIQHLEHLEPFGNQNPQPMFLIEDVSQLKPPQLLKDKHIKTTVFSQGAVKPLIIFNRPDLYEPLLQHEDKQFTLAAHVVVNEWNGNTNYDLHGVDIAL